MKTIYDSAFHHPLAAYAFGILTLVFLARRLGFLYGYVAVFLVTILADATVTGALSPIPVGTRTYTAFSVLFIILGDFRYFLLLERVARPEVPFATVFVRALATSLVLPVVTGLMTRFIPGMGENDRVLYLVYEAGAALLVLALDRYRLASSTASPDERRFVHGASLLFAGLYVGWAFCDAVILGGFEVGHVLRIVPNVLYYGVFVLFVLLTAPTSIVRRWPGSSNGIHRIQ